MMMIGLNFMSQWTVVVPLQVINKSEPRVTIFLEAGSVLDGIEVPAMERTASDPRIGFTYDGEAFTCERWDLEVCARPTA
jgi:hypothetical protein